MSYRNDDESGVNVPAIFGVSGAIVLLLILIVVGMIGCPRYNVYEQRMEGQAVLAHAQSSREVAVAEAKAKMESADLLAKAEVIRAGGVAQANKIIGESLKGNEAYLRYLWIQNLENSKDNQVIYVPTEAGLPILEAGRLKGGR
jgi:regulator of protease activity HflC (stomatin/prohibitin superfamily)